MFLEYLNIIISTCTKNVSSGHRKKFCLSKAERIIKVNLETGIKIIWSERYVGG
jgi:lambda repressor-like predicted transcriptional regulator